LPRKNRKNDELRPIKITLNYLSCVPASTLIEQGNTICLVNTTVNDSVPPFLQGSGKGWITAEYAMLPKSTPSRLNRERKSISGRTFEIQRLIGRSMRAAFNYERLGERTIRIDCDVIQADGGTRCASITGAFIAVFDAIRYLYDKQLIYNFPDYNVTAAISLGIKKNEILLDLDYNEDSSVDVDINLVMSNVNNTLEYIEIQGTAEGATFKREKLNKILEIGEQGISELIQIQKKELNL